MHPIRFLASITTLALCLTAVVGPPGALAQSAAPSAPITGRWQTPELTQTRIHGALEAAGLPADGIASFMGNAGWTYPIVWSVQFDDGHYLLQGGSGGGVLQTLDQATYKVVDDHTLVLTNDCCVVTFDYAVSGDVLTLRQVAQTNDPGGDSTYYGTAIFGVAPFQLVVESAAPSPTQTGTTPARSPAPGTASASSDWPMFRGDAGRRSEAAEGPIGQPVLRWRYQAQGAVGAAISVVGDLAYAGSDDGILHALDLASGTERWQWAPQHTPVSAAVEADGVAYAFDGLGTLYALDAATGQERWHAAAPLNGPSGPAVADGGLYVGTSDGALVAIDTATGSERWRYVVSSTGGGVHSPALSGGLVYVGSDSGGLVAVAAGTGKLVWHVDTGTDQTATAVVADGIAYIGAGPDSATGRLRALDAATGAPLWQVDELLFAPAVSQGVAYSGSNSGLVVANDTATGKELWRFQVKGTARGTGVAQGVVYVPADAEHRVYALDAATGRELWHFDLDGPNDGGIAIAHGSVFVGSSLGGVYDIGGSAAPAASLAPAASSVPATGTPVASASAPTAISSISPVALLPEGRYATAPVTPDQISAAIVAAGYDPGQWQTTATSTVFTLSFDGGRLTAYGADDGGVIYHLWDGPYHVVDAHTLMATDTSLDITTTYDYSLVGDVLTMKLVHDTNQEPGELSAQTAIYNTAPFIRQP